MIRPEAGNNYPAPIRTRHAESTDPSVEIDSGTYPVSEFEHSVEQLCNAFYTWPAKAKFNPFEGAKLSRLSDPVILDIPETNQSNLIQFEWTRFSPRAGDTRGIQVAYARLNEPIEHSIHLHRRIISRRGSANTFLEVTDPQYFPDVTIDQWEEKAYAAVYNLNNLQRLPQQEDLKPFHIFKPHTTALHKYTANGRGILPDAHVTLKQNPVINSELTDSIGYRLEFRFPATSKRHEDSVRQALQHSQYGENNPFKIPDMVRQYQDNNKGAIVYEISKDVDIKDIFDFTQNYLQAHMNVD